MLGLVDLFGPEPTSEVLVVVPTRPIALPSSWSYVVRARPRFALRAYYVVPLPPRLGDAEVDQIVSDAISGRIRRTGSARSSVSVPARAPVDI